jgi:hypothetical protein
MNTTAIKKASRQLALLLRDRLGRFLRLRHARPVTRRARRPRPLRDLTAVQLTLF